MSFRDKVKLIIIKKAACQKAVFLFSILLLQIFFLFEVQALAQTQKVKVEDLKLDEVKKKSASFLLLKQKKSALDLINEFLIEARNRNYKLETVKKAQDLKKAVLMTFLDQEIQDQFETAVGLLLNQDKKAVKMAQKCLDQDSLLWQCQWILLKSINEDKNSLQYLTITENLKTLFLDIPEVQPLLSSLLKDKSEFKSLKLDQTFETDIYDYKLLKLIWEFDRSYRVKNFALAQQSYQALEKMALDYPNLLILKLKLEMLESNQSFTSKYKNQVFEIYLKKCEDVSSEVIKKYFFDIDFCNKKIEID